MRLTDVPAASKERGENRLTGVLSETSRSTSLKTGRGLRIPAPKGPITVVSSEKSPFIGEIQVLTAG
jgi:hypothetical protein